MAQKQEINEQEPQILESQSTTIPESSSDSSSRENLASKILQGRQDIMQDYDVVEDEEEDNISPSNHNKNEHTSTGNSHRQKILEALEKTDYDSQDLLNNQYSDYSSQNSANPEDDEELDWQTVLEGINTKKKDEYVPAHELPPEELRLEFDTV